MSFLARVLFGVALILGILFFPFPSGRVYGAIQATLIDVQGQSHTGIVTEWTTDEISLAIPGEPAKKYAAKDALELWFDHKRTRPHLSTATIFLANGDRLVASPQSIDDTQAIAHWGSFPGWPLVHVPLETITGFILDMPEIASRRSEALRTVLDREQNLDLVHLKNGDQAGGEFLELSEASLKLNGPVGEMKIDRQNIRLVTMNRELTSFPKVEGMTLLLAMIDGSLMTVTDLRFVGQDRLKLKTAFGTELDIPVTAVVSVRFLGGRAVYLSDMVPLRYEHKPYLSGKWDLKTDRNILGEPMVLDGQDYPKGLGMHSQSEVSYDLKGEYQTFRATMGLDDAALNQGSVVFVVDVDGQEKYRSEPQSARDTALKLPPISVKDAKELKLKVEFGEFGDARDYANWCDAVLVR